MTFYHQQLLRIREMHYPADHLAMRLLRAKNFIDENEAANLDMEILARQAMLSKFHFARLFHQFYGRTPHQYVTERKLLKARTLLKCTTVQDTCHALGFESRTSFSALFKRYTGVTPSVFRKKQDLIHQSH
jgi:AraC-like DNA-binding protein